MGEVARFGAVAITLGEVDFVIELHVELFNRNQNKLMVKYYVSNGTNDFS